MLIQLENRALCCALLEASGVGLGRSGILGQSRPWGMQRGCVSWGFFCDLGRVWEGVWRVCGIWDNTWPRQGAGNVTLSLGMSPPNPGNVTPSLCSSASSAPGALWQRRTRRCQA